MNDYRFGNFICYLRTESGLSQSQLGDMMGVSNKAVSKWEMGVSKPRPAMLVALATFFGVTVEELLAGERNAETEKEGCEKSKDNSIKLWAGEYLKKKKRGLVAVLTSVFLPMFLFVWVGVIVGVAPDDKIVGPIGAMVILFAEAISITLIIVFYCSARRLKRFLYATYHEQKDDITAILSPKKEKVPMLKWEKICIIISCSIIALGYVLRLIVHCIVDTANILRVFDGAVLIPECLAAILAIIVLIHYYIRASKINKQ